MDSESEPHPQARVARQTRDPLLESITILEMPPEHWQQGVKHLVLFHIEEIHDYTAVAVDLRNPKSCRPVTRTLPSWHLGVLDGERPPPRLFEYFPHHLPPPLTYTFRHGRAEGVEDNDAALQQEARDQGSRTVRDAIDRDGERLHGEEHRDRRHDSRDNRGGQDRRRGRNRRYNNDHPDDDLHHGGQRDNDYDDDRDNRGRDVTCGRGGIRGLDVNFRCERTRSPRARDRGDTRRRDGRRHQAGCGDKEDRDNDCGNGDSPQAALTPTVAASSSARNAHLTSPPFDKGPLLPPRRPHDGAGYEARSAASIPAARVFARINEAVAAASAEGALRQMLVTAGVAVALDKLAAPVALDKPAANAAVPSPMVTAMASLATISSTTRKLLPIASTEKTLLSLNAECAAAPTLQDALATNGSSPAKDTETAPAPDIAEFDSI
ncbi:uncharacterized protein [Oryza sativa Japonica Group]|uniref:Os07g0515200 protein n=1 Tax=Oryza sativa subsp. japonica TaxID=39947 RepID=A0A0P0X6P7_ORYSJ|nr:pre-mRNA-processing ATP-dependent RNA helicase prp-5 isoform X1 [Oryza sativa Japonica Group]BAT01751.1 Os07g0515200 [Oryza sativa Japonica Group]